MSTIYGTTNPFPGVTDNKIVQLNRTGGDHYLRLRIPDTLAFPLPPASGTTDDLSSEPNRFLIQASPNHLRYGSPIINVQNVWYNNPAILASRFTITTNYTCPIDLYPTPEVSAQVGMLVKDIDGSWFVPTSSSFPRRCTHTCDGNFIPVQISYCRVVEYDEPGSQQTDTCEGTSEPFPSDPRTIPHTVDWIGLVLHDTSANKRIGVGLGLWQFLYQAGQNQIVYSYLYPTGFVHDIVTNSWTLFVNQTPVGGSSNWARFQRTSGGTYQAYYGVLPVFSYALGANVRVGVSKLLLECYSGDYSDNFNETHQMMFETVGYCAALKSSEPPMTGSYQVSDTQGTPKRWRLRPITNGAFTINGETPIYNTTGNYWQLASDAASTSATFGYQLTGNQLLDRHEHWTESVPSVQLEARWSARFQHGSPFVGRARRGDLLVIEYSLSQNGAVNIYQADRYGNPGLLLASNLPALANTWHSYSLLPPGGNAPFYYRVEDASNTTRYVLLELSLEDEPTTYALAFVKYPLGVLGLNLRYVQRNSSAYGGWVSLNPWYYIRIGPWGLVESFARYLEVWGIKA